MIYVALLRGINVGGKNLIDMKRLKEVFVQAGMEHVRTYINSGNIIFASDLSSRDQIASTLEKAIQEHFGLQIKVLIRDIEEMQHIIKALPDSWKNDEEMKSDVLFLWEAIDEPGVLERLKLKEGIDTAIYVPGAVLCSVDRKNVTRSGLHKLIEQKEIYSHVTIRNVNTTRKIYAFMEEARDKMKG